VHARASRHPHAPGAGPFIDDRVHFVAAFGTIVLTQPHQRFVERDLAQPAPERRLAAKCIDALKYFQHCVMQYIARAFGIAKQAHREGVDRPLEAPVDLFERAQVARTRTREQSLRDIDLER